VTRPSLVIVGFALASSVATSLGGCSTVRGAGEDIGYEAPPPPLPPPPPPVFLPLPPPSPPPPLFQLEQQQQPPPGPRERIVRPRGHEVIASAATAAIVSDAIITTASACNPRDLDCNPALWGRGAFRDPPKMWVGTPETLEFAVARTDRGLGRELGQAGLPTSIRDVYIGRCMRVTLIAPPSLEIRSPNGVITRLARDMDRASWSWSVMPVDPGQPKVRAKVEVLRQEGGRCTSEAFDEYTEHVDVQIEIGWWRGFLRALGEARSAGDLFSALFASWERAFTALGLLVAAIGGAYAAIKKLSKRKRKLSKQ
jgi:predicted small secreted protein